jgi:outer membrane protein, multidrug efflux system
MMKVTFSLLMLLFIGACSTATPATTDAAGSEDGQTESTNTEWTLQPWWLDFDRPELALAVQATLQGNLDLKSAAARLRQVEIQSRIIAGNQMPSASVGLQAARSRTNLIGLPFPGAPEVLPITTSQMGLGLNLSWELDLWGRMEAEEEAAIAQWQAGQADWQGAQLSLSAQVGKTWLSAAATEMELQLSEKLAADADRIARHLEQRYQSGLAPANLMQSAQSNAQLAHARLSGLRIQLDQQQRSLRTMTGGDTQVNLATLPTIPAPFPESLPADAIARRPDLRAAEAQILGAEAQHQVARSSLYPRLSLTASGGTSSNTLSDLLDGDLRVWSLAGNLVAPLFEGGKLRNQVELRAAGIEEKQLQFVQRALLAYAEVENALLAEQELRGQLQTMDRVVQQALSDQNRAQRRFQQGTGTLLDLLQVQMTHTQKKMDLLQVQLQLLLNRVNLYLAVGGDLRGVAIASKYVSGFNHATHHCTQNCCSCCHFGRWLCRRNLVNGNCTATGTSTASCNLAIGRSIAGAIASPRIGRQHSWRTKP